MQLAAGGFELETVGPKAFIDIGQYRQAGDVLAVEVADTDNGLSGCKAPGFYVKRVT